MSTYHSAASVLTSIHTPPPPQIEGPAAQYDVGPTGLSQMRLSGGTRGLEVLTYLHLHLQCQSRREVAEFFSGQADRLVKSSDGSLLFLRSAARTRPKTFLNAGLGQSTAPLGRVDRTLSSVARFFLK